MLALTQINAIKPNDCGTGGLQSRTKNMISANCTVWKSLFIGRCWLTKEMSVKFAVDQNLKGKTNSLSTMIMDQAKSVASFVFGVMRVSVVSEITRLDCALLLNI